MLFYFKKEKKQLFIKKKIFTFFLFFVTLFFLSLNQVQAKEVDISSYISELKDKTINLYVDLDLKAQNFYDGSKEEIKILTKNTFNKLNNKIINSNIVLSQKYNNLNTAFSFDSINSFSESLFCKVKSLFGRGCNNKTENSQVATKENNVFNQFSEKNTEEDVMKNDFKKETVQKNISNSNTNNITIYGISKAELEQRLIEFKRELELNPIAIRESIQIAPKQVDKIYESIRKSSDKKIDPNFQGESVSVSGNIIALGDVYSNDLTITGIVTSTSTATSTFSGSIVATQFVGDGSLLTNLPFFDISTVDTDDLVEGINNKYYSQALFDASFASSTTDNLLEGSTNKYFTNQRAIDALTGQNISLFTNDSNYLSSISGLNISDLINDSGYLNSISGLSISDLNNDAGYISNLSTFDTDDLVQGSTNLYSQWGTNGSNIYYTGGNVGIGTSNPSATLDITSSGSSIPIVVNKSSQSGVREKIMQSNISDAGTSGFYIYNGTIVDGAFSPTFAAMNNNNSTVGSLNFHGFVTSANDTGTTPVVSFNALRSTSETDPLNGTLSSLSNRTAFDFRSNSTIFATILSSGNVGIGTTTPGSKLSVSGGGTFGSGYGSTSAPTNGLLVEGGTAIGTNTNAALTEFGSRNFALRVDSTNFTGYGIVLERTDQTQNTGAPVFALMRRNTSSAAVSNGNQIGRIGGWGWDGDEYVLGGETQFVVDGSVSDQNVPTAFAILTGTQNSTLTERLRVTSSGNVGIGTTTPDQKLQVGGIIKSSGTVGSMGLVADYIGGKAAALVAGTSRASFLFDNSGSFSIQPRSRTDVITGTADGASSVFEVLASGNVGIGTTTPTSLLTLNESTSSTGGIGFGSDVAFYRSGTGQLSLSLGGAERMRWGINSGTGQFQMVGNGNAVAPKYSWSTDTNTGMYLENTSTLAFSTAGVNRVVIGSTGNIGIGTTTPSYLLTVASGQVAAAGGTAATPSYSFFQSPNMGMYRINANTMGIAVNGSNQLTVGIGSVYTSGTISAGNGTVSTTSFGHVNAPNTGLYLTSTTAGISISGTSAIHANSSGNVGIGTTTPATRLHIHQTSSASTREQIARFTLSDGGNSAFIFSNGTVNDNIFNPQMAGFTDQATAGLAVAGLIMNTADSGTAPITAFNSMLTNNATDPLNGTLTSPSVRPLFTWQSGANVYMTMAAGGSIGIGTTTPLARLSVNRNNASFTPVSVGGNSEFVANFADNFAGVSGIQMGNVSTSTSADFRFLIKDNTDHYFAFAQPGINNNLTLFGLNRNTTNYIFSAGGTGRDLAIGTATDNDIVFATNAFERMRVDNNGNIGIGITLPATKLSVGSVTTALSNVAGADALTVSANNAGSAIVMASENRSGTDGAFSGLYRNTGSAMVAGNRLGGFLLGGSSNASTLQNTALIGAFAEQSWVHGSAYGSYLTFETVSNNSTTRTEKLRITAGGNVGIGTTSPSAQLHTTGTVRFANFGAGTLTTDANGNVSVSSDERLKNISGDFSSGLDAVLGLNPILYKWNTKSGLETQTTYAGFSAQNVRDFIPEAVGESPNGFLSLNDRPILAVVVNAVKELAVVIKSFTKEFRTEKLCVGDTCIDEAQLIQLLNNQNVNPVQVENQADDQSDSTSNPETNTNDGSEEVIYENTQNSLENNSEIIEDLGVVESINTESVSDSENLQNQENSEPVVSEPESVPPVEIIENPTE